MPGDSSAGEAGHPGGGARLRTRRAYEGRLLTVDLDTVRLPNGHVTDLEMVRHRGAAAVVPLLSDERAPDPQVLLIRQFRWAAEGRIWEIPAGVLEPGESPEDCARRELREETGGVAARMERLTTVYTTPGFTDERIHLFLATGITAGDPAPEGDEVIEARAFPLSHVMEMIRKGDVVDGKSIAALLYVAGFRLGW